MRLYKFRSLKNLQYVLDILLLERLHCAPYNKLNDPCEGWFISSQYIGLYYKSHFHGFSSTPQKTKKTVEDLYCNDSILKICSLSKTLSDIQLWSYYADGHQGVAIEIDFSGIEKDVTEVKYLSHLSEHSIGGLLSEGSKPEEVLSEKMIHWKYEEEYRIIQDAEFYPVIGKITGVYMGIRSERYRDILIKVVPPSIPLIHTKLNPFNLTIEPSEVIHH